jgi:exopolyphosphatase/guanosine-5'-triphosphate,3'-diphosphate pyrophosphatase
MIENCASIDIGTHTARLLVARKPEAQGRLKPLARKRAYIRLGEGFSYSEGKKIQPEAIDRTLEVFEDFLQCTRLFDVHEVHAVATGVVREATNRDEFLDLIHSHTGIHIRPITGEEEALLTGKGVVYALNVQSGPFLVFDLGGGSTEFFLSTEDMQVVRSILIGSMILKQAFLKSDPPKDRQVDALSRHIDKMLEGLRLAPIHSGSCLLVAGTGGTVTTLAAMLNSISLEDITPERINGLILTVKQLEGLFDEIKRLPYEERLKMPGLDPDRAEVILGGCLAVIRILYFFKSLQVTVSMSDLLEGVLICYAEGEKNG